MSVLFSLTAVGIAMGITAIGGALTVVTAFSEHKCGDTEIAPVQTRFSDETLLVKTLQDHGFAAVRDENGALIVRTTAGSLRFTFSEETGSYWVQAYELVDEASLADSLESVSTEYLRNVQSNNYRILTESVAESDTMTIASEEALEDDSILLTINL